MPREFGAISIKVRCKCLDVFDLEGMLFLEARASWSLRGSPVCFGAYLLGVSEGTTFVSVCEYV